MSTSSGIYVEIEIQDDLDHVWLLTQDPAFHERWDLRFSRIHYLPRSSSAEPQQFLYETRIGFGLSIKGTGESIGQCASSKLATAFSGNSSVTVSASGAALNLTAKSNGAASNYSYSSSETFDSANFSSASFAVSPASGSLAGGTDQSYTPTTVYSFSIPASGGFAANGNLLSSTESVMGQWSYGYDNLNRLTSGHPSSGSYNGQYACWSYDAFGNRTNEAVSTTACTGSPTPTTWATYNTYSQISGTNLMASGDTYDAAGDILDDGANQYRYDGENRLCAVHNSTTGVMTQYVYDAEGNRVAKGSISTFNCDSISNGFSVTNSYVLGQGNEQISELDGAGHWYHTNVFAGGKLLATYGGGSTYFALNDWLGTKRVETTPDGVTSACYLSLPFGSGLTTACASGPDATEHHFTGKERDSESNLDFFMARYYSSKMGRFMSPDWAATPEAIPYSNLSDPQSLDLYGFVRNNPLGSVDPNGHDFQKFWSDLKAAVSETTGKISIGLGIGAGTKVGFVQAKLEVAYKVNVTFSKEKHSLSQSVNDGATLGKGHTKGGFEVSAEQVLVSVDKKTGGVGGPEAPTGEVTAGISKGDSTGSGSQDAFSFGVEGGEGALAGVELSITPGGIDDLKAAWNDLWAPTPKSIQKKQFRHPESEDALDDSIRTLQEDTHDPGGSFTPMAPEPH